ncbi:MAG: hypothetical protein B9S32_04405 [Verrucomicrobia bacterium Tous-C9LFEB]|nr:MAG: hypothetical protein B9S32_04405 [Verrucomicrobia bacterium Tous-C9LFEB]
MNKKKIRSPESFLTSGKFITGVNYWQSQTATEMWSKWDEKEVDKDFKALATNGTRVLRVFPLWPDFQPITRMYLGDGTPTSEFRFGEEALPDTEAGRAGVSEVMMQRFERLAALAAQHQISLIVALLTGQMTFRLYMPPGLAGLSPLNHPVALAWERRFVQYFVKRMKGHHSIVAWDFGNECDMWKSSNREEAWCWMAYISDAIRVCDNTRPIVSGMSARHVDDSVFSKENWPAQSQAEHCDILTSHSYIQWGFGGSDPCDTIKQTVAPTVEVRLATDISGKPAFMEEIGLAWRPMLASYNRLGAYIRTNLWNLWADDCRGLLWWCGFDQSHLAIAPYNWEAPGPEHGIMDKTRKPWSSGLELKQFRNFLDDLPFDTLPAAEKKVVCLIGDYRQKQTVAATGAYILAKQAGFNIEFQHANQPLKPAELYLLPSAKGKCGLSVEGLENLKKAVRQGASLYMSTDDVYMPGIAELFSAEVENRFGKEGHFTFDFELDTETVSLTLPLKATYQMKSLGARVRGRSPEGSPVFFEATYGKGKVFLLSFPLETIMAETPLAFLEKPSTDAWKIYAYVAKDLLAKRVIIKESPQLFVTEHLLSPKEMACLVVNNGPQRVASTLLLKSGWRLKKCLSAAGSAKPCESGMNLSLPGNSGAVLMLAKT